MDGRKARGLEKWLKVLLLWKMTIEQIVLEDVRVDKDDCMTVQTETVELARVPQRMLQSHVCCADLV